MTGQKTHEQQQRIINRQENTKGGGSGFPAEDDLSTSKNIRRAKTAGDRSISSDRGLSDPDDRNMVRGQNQESRGKK